MQSYSQNKISVVKFVQAIIHLIIAYNCIYKSVCYLKLAQYF